MLLSLLSGSFQAHPPKQRPWDNLPIGCHPAFTTRFFATFDQPEPFPFEYPKSPDPASPHPLSPPPSFTFPTLPLSSSPLCLSPPSSSPLHRLPPSKQQQQHAPIVCSQCHRTFTRMANLKRHVRTHTGEKRFFCMDRSCMQKRVVFMEKHHLMAHIRTHTGEMPFACLTCARPFRDNSNMLRHVLKLHGERAHRRAKQHLHELKRRQRPRILPTQIFNPFSPKASPSSSSYDFPQEDPPHPPHPPHPYPMSHHHQQQPYSFFQPHLYEAATPGIKKEEEEELNNINMLDSKDPMHHFPPFGISSYYAADPIA